jgi:hypothetical protein
MTVTVPISITALAARARRWRRASRPAITSPGPCFAYTAGEMTREHMAAVLSELLVIIACKSSRRRWPHERPVRDRAPGPRGGPAVGASRAASTEGNRAMLLDTINAAGVQLGEYDRRIIDWLAGWETATCAVVASLIARAAEPMPGVDSESWTCASCGGQMIGQRPADDCCQDCSPAQQGGEWWGSTSGCPV